MSRSLIRVAVMATGPLLAIAALPASAGADSDPVSAPVSEPVSESGSAAVSTGISTVFSPRISIRVATPIITTAAGRRTFVRCALRPTAQE